MCAAGSVCVCVCVCARARWGLGEVDNLFLKVYRSRGTVLKKRRLMSLISIWT